MNLICFKTYYSTGNMTIIVTRKDTSFESILIYSVNCVLGFCFVDLSYFILKYLSVKIFKKKIF